MTDSVAVHTSNRACALLYEYIARHGDGVYLLPVNVCPDVPLTFVEAGVDFEFVDIDSRTLCIDVDACVRIIGASRQRYVGVVFVHTYGCEYPGTDAFTRLRSVAPQGFKIIDDRCLCLPSLSPSMCGGDVELYSTGHCKQVDLGYGAVAKYASAYVFDTSVVSDYKGTDEVPVYKEALAKRLPISQMPYGWLSTDRCKYSDDEYFALIRQGIEQRSAKREAINHIYRSMLPAEVQLPAEYQQWRFNIMVDPDVRDTVLKALFDNGLFASAHYQPVNTLFREHRDLDFPNAYALWHRVINLFNDAHYTPLMAESTCEVILRCLSSR